MTLLNKSLALLLSLSLAAIITIWFYASAYKGSYEALQVSFKALEKSIELNNEIADERLQFLTDERDKAQAKINQQSIEREIADNEAIKTIAALNDELNSRPIRVRYITKTAQRDSCPSSDASADTTDSGGDATETTGLLPESNSRRLRDAVNKVETLSAAYNSCRDTLLNRN